MGVERALVLKEGLALGLRRDARSARNTQELVALQNLRPSANGLVVSKTVTLPPSFPTVSWPNPQLLRGKSQTFLCNETSISTLSEADWSATELTLYDAYSDLTAGSIIAGKWWHLVDFFDTWILLNGSSVVFHTNEYLMQGRADKNLVQSTISMQAGCDFRGQAIFGGFNVANYYNSKWTDFWTDWNTRAGTGVEIQLTMNSNFVSWSSIGGGDLLWQIELDKALLGYANGYDYGYDKPLLFDYMSNGFMPIPYYGSILAVKALENVVIVYTTSGIGALVPGIVGDIPTFGFRHLLYSGIKGRGAVGGDLHEHVFIDNEGDVWRLTPELQPKLLGYKEFFSSLTAADLGVAFESGDAGPIARREYYLGDGSATYILTPQGLCSSSLKPTSLIRSGSSVVGAAVAGSLAGLASVSLTSDTIDCGDRGRKVIGWIEVGCTDIADLAVSLYYRYDASETFFQTDWVEANNEGCAFLGVACQDFRVAVQGTAGSDAHVDYIKIRWRQDDARYRRGLEEGAGQQSAS